MTRPKRKKNIRHRRESLLKSLDSTDTGGMTTHAFKLAPPGWLPAECTITGYCRTSIFEFPGSYLIEHVNPRRIYSGGGLTAAIVSALPAYFEEKPADSLHFGIDVSLRAWTRATYDEAVEETSSKPQRTLPLFLVVQEYRKGTPTILNSGECFTIDEFRDGEERIEGGREGERALVAIKTTDGSWPDIPTDTHAINVVLAAVKAEQDYAQHIELRYRCSCFVSTEGQAVYTVVPRIGQPSVRTKNRIDSSEMQNKAGRIASMLQHMVSEAEPAALELFDALLLDKTKDDEYLRLWYLRLWQAVEDAGGHLGYPQLSNVTDVIAGDRTPKELKNYRNQIAHWYTAIINFSYVSDLQHTAIELLRRKYRPT